MAEGLSDYLRGVGLHVFGPSKASAQLEGSKAFAKLLMQKCGIPTASACITAGLAAAKEYAYQCELPIVIKVDGLASGKGVRIVRTRQEAADAVTDFMGKKVFGDSGNTILFEKMLVGREVSVFAFCNGRTFARPLVTACDYKTAGERNTGPNTGGMGAYSPSEFWNEELERQAKEIIQRTLDAMADKGMPFHGVLYVGFMLTAEGLKVLEFNVRFGDPEAQVILPRMITPLSSVIEATIDGTLDVLSLQWAEEVCVGVVIASAGYPGTPQIGFQVYGLQNLDPRIFVFKGGMRNGGTTAGRVLTIAACGKSFAEAQQVCYANVRRISFEGSWYRTDIAQGLS